MKAATKTLDPQTRIEFKNILFLTDFSPAASAAVPYAAEAAKKFGAKLYALHVRANTINPMTQPATWVALEQVSEREREQQIETLKKEFSGMQPEVVVEEGELWPVMQSLVEKNSVDLIVLGTRGRSGLGKFFLGSTAEEIFRLAPCAVMTVGPYSNGELRQSGEFKNILYATDFGPASEAAAALAVSMAQEFQARLTLLHVIDERKPNDLVQPEELITASMNRLRKLVPSDAEIWCAPRFHVEFGKAGETILEAAKLEKADLIVLGVHRPAGLTGAATHLPVATAHKVVSHASCPVLTVRA